MVQNEKTKLGIIGIEEDEDFKFKGQEKIFSKMIEEKFPNLKKEMAINVKEAYRTIIRLNQKRTSWHIIPQHPEEARIPGALTHPGS